MSYIFTEQVDDNTFLVKTTIKGIRYSIGMIKVADGQFVACDYDGRKLNVYGDKDKAIDDITEVFKKIML